MRPASAAALGIVAYVVFLVATLPASFVAARLPADPGLRIEWEEANGTIWAGRARATLAPRAAAPIHIDAIAWRFKPSRLAAGRIAFDAHLTANGATVRLEAARAWSHWEARDLQIHAGAGAIVPWFPLASAWHPGGELVVAAPRMQWDSREPRGEARIEWRNATLALSDVRPLGSYRLDWRSAGGPGAFSVSTLEGPLHVSGRGTTTPAGRIAFSGEASAEASAAKDLERLLDLLGARRPDGARAIELRR